MNDKAREVRIAWADASLRIWESVIREEEDEHLDLLRENGWAWAIGVDEDYCGHTHAVAGRHIGHHLWPSLCVDVELRPDLRRRTFPSCVRLAGRGPTGSEPDPPFEHPDPRKLAKGDIATVGSGEWGSHIIMVTSSPTRDGVFETVEGNSYGQRGDGSMGQGVVRKTRNVADVVCTYRITLDHLRGNPF